MSYISELQIDDGSIQPIGSSLYGICNSNVDAYAKVVTLANFDSFIPGVTIHVKFTNGNSAPLTNPSNNTQHLTLAVGSTAASQVANPGGNINWSAGAVISFTLDGNASPYTWIVNDSDSGQSVTIEQDYNNPNSSNAISSAGVTDALSTLGDAAYKGIVTSIIDSGANANNTNNTVPTTAAIASYVADKTAGLTGAMHFIGISTTAVTDGGTETPTISGRNFTTNPVEAGDVILYRNANNVIGQEYVWTGTAWELLGDEGSYLLENQVEDTSVISSVTWDAGSATSITLSATTSVLTGVTNTATATVTTAEVTNGLLKITTGVLPTFGTGSVTGVTSVTNGTAPSLSTGSQNVLKKVTQST